MNQPLTSAVPVKAASSVQQQQATGYELDVPIQIIVAIIMVSAGLVIWRLTAWSNARQARTNRLADASKTFREAFASDILKIENCSSTQLEPVCDILHAAHERHSLAVKNFMPFLADDNLKRLNATWQAHCYDDEPLEEGNAWALFLHFTRDAHGGKLEAAKAAATNSLRKLQSFANAA